MSRTPQALTFRPPAEPFPKRSVRPELEPLEARLLLATAAKTLGTAATPGTSGVQVGASTSSSSSTMDDSNDAPLDLSSAHDLPTEWTQGWSETVDPSGPPPLFRIPIDGATAGLDIEVHPGAGDGPAVSASLTIFDDRGRRLLDVPTTPGDATLYMALPPAFTAARRALYLRLNLTPVAPGSPGGSVNTGSGISGGGSGAPETLVLSVRREGPSLATAGQTTGIFPGFVAVPPAAPGRGGAWTSGELSPSHPSSGDAPSASPTSIPVALPVAPTPAPVAVATGPLPSFSASALGGWLGAAEQTPAVSLGDTLVVDLALAAVAPRDLNEPVEPAGPNPDPLVDSADAWLGSGGFPLLGTALIAPRADEREVVGAPGGSEVVAALGAWPIPALAAEDCPTQRQGARDGVSIGAGLSMAVAFVAGLALPDVTDPRRRAARTGALAR
jgi:hypothetical protein